MASMTGVLSETKISQRHLVLYDIMLPLLCILSLGAFLSRQFDSALLHWLDSARFLGLGAWFSHSAFRTVFWNHAWLFFSLPPALLWLVWVRINVEYDYVARARRLDRPIFALVNGFYRWVEGADAIRWQLESARFRMAQAEDRVRRLEGELERMKKDYADLESDYQALEEEASALDELDGRYQAGAHGV